VRHVVSTSSAFAALLADGRVVTWGQAAAGGDCTLVAEMLKDGEKDEPKGGSLWDENGDFTSKNSRNM